MYSNSLDVLCLEKFKEAALYFDRVIPVQCNSLMHDDNGPYVTTPEHVPVGVISKLIYEEDAPDWKVLEFMDKKWSPFARALHSEFKQIQDLSSENYCDLYELNTLGSKGMSIRDHFSNFSKSLGVETSSVLLRRNVEKSDFQTAYISVSLKGIGLIDSDKASWDQIMELRSDPVSKGSLRNLRLFIYENYVGKPASYIEDDLCKRIELYDSSAKKHGFDLTTSVLGVLLDSKNIQASLAAGITAGLFGGVEVGIGAAVALEIAKGSLEISKKLYSFESFKNNHDLAYLIDTKTRIEKC